MPANLNIKPSASFDIQQWFDSRAALREGFLDRAGWAGVKLEPVGEDCAFRRYFRLRRGNETAILMESVPAGTDIATPGHNPGDFIWLASWLRGNNLNAPEIYKADELEGYILMEDFGDTSFRKAMEQGIHPVEIYGLATAVLDSLRRIDARDLSLPRYYDSHVHAGRRRVVDWYMPAVLKRKNADGLAGDYLAVWDAIEKKLPPCPQGFLHIDYHVENLMWLSPPHSPPQAGGIKGGSVNDLSRCGILDFQGAMIGPVPYDLVNLLEDARMDISEDIRAAMLDRFCEGLTPPEREAFRAWYRVLATQFHCRVIGQFVRLAVRDNKTRYLQHLPRLAHYIARGLEDPLLAPLKSWFAAQGVSFANAPAVDPAALRPLIRPDAF